LIRNRKKPVGPQLTPRFSSTDGHYYLELDGLQPGPINHGPCIGDVFPDRVLDLIGDRIITYFKIGEIRFNVLAVTKDPRIALRADPDAMVELENEEGKRERWTKENVLRWYNFVNMIYLIAKVAVEQAVRQGGGVDALIEEGKMEAWRKKQVADAVEKMRKGIMPEIP